MQITEQNMNLRQITKKKMDRIDPVTRVKALILDDVNLTRSGPLDTSYRVLDDATFNEGKSASLEIGLGLI